MKHVPYNEYLVEVIQQLRQGGLFLNTKGEKNNTMTIGWGGINIYWSKPIFVVPVRKSRYTHGLIEKAREFTVSVPLKEDMVKALEFCGTRSGRDFDKFKECNLTPVPGQKVNAPIIKECSLHYECKVVYKQDMVPDNLDAEIAKQYYSPPDYHTLYFGDIVACYLT